MIFSSPGLGPGGAWAAYCQLVPSHCVIYALPHERPQVWVLSSSQVTIVLFLGSPQPIDQINKPYQGRVSQRYVLLSPNFLWINYTHSSSTLLNARINEQANCPVFCLFVRVCVVERLIAKVGIGGSTRLPGLGLGGKHEVSDGPGQDLNPDRRGWRDRRVVMPAWVTARVNANKKNIFCLKGARNWSRKDQGAAAKILCHARQPGVVKGSQ